MDIEFYNKLNQALHGDAGKIDRVMRFRYLNAVSYTHLTLPTIYSV